MVLWEITLTTAYFLGLKRTYRLALKLQRRIVSPRRQKIRQFLHRRTRNVFDVALTVHRKIQERDIEVGRSFGNWILRWLDKMKPQAEIRGKHLSDTTSTTKQSSHNSSNACNQESLTKHNATTKDKESSGRHLFAATRANVWSRSFPAISMMVRPTRPVGHDAQYRHYGWCNDPVLRFGSRDVVRSDIRLWLMNH